MKDEKWQDIEGFENLYQVSDRGRVRSLDRVGGNASRPHPIQGKILHHRYSECGPKVRLQIPSGKRVFRSVRKLVAIAFLGMFPEGHFIQSKDGDVQNVLLGNLRYKSKLLI
jgi:hypothetical protein